VTASVQERIFDVRGTRVAVTGAASGLGFAMAEVLAECGARVTLADIDAERLERAIVVTSSTAGLRPEPEVCYGYVASKAAIVHLVRQAALELAPQGVHVNAICPGPFKGTRIGGGVTENPEPELEQTWARTVALGRMGELDELKGLVLLLASPASSFMTGVPRRRRHARLASGSG
jgi:NAD(P)-dependent dehydrogenase (short-subunit alcohol dehydrogenase family)